MQLTQLFLRKLKLQMRLLHIVQKRPNRIIKLDPLDPEEFNISEQAVGEWSQNNLQLYQLILQNGMAEFICNKDYLFEFYSHLSFTQKSINLIDEASFRFKNLKVLSLIRNNIKYIDNLPSNCKELYLDFNQIEDIHQKTSNDLELLSISHNIITDTVFYKIVKVFSQLRCVNLSWNRIQKIKDFVQLLVSLSKLKVLVAYGNPISMLALYYSYITEHVNLLYIDGQKYVKPEEVKKVEEPKVEEKKEVKQEKKQNKKQTKKAGKVEEKPVQPPKVQPPKIEVKRQLTKDDFQRVKVTVKITNLQQFSGNSFDASLFPAQVDIKKIQTNYWIKYKFLDQQVQLKQKMVSLDSITIENDQTRLNLETTIVNDFVVGYGSLLKFNRGLQIQVHQIEPKMVKDTDNLQLKPEMNNGQISMNTSILGAIFVDLRQLHTAQKKEIRFKYRLFSAQAVRNPLFADSYEDEAELISKGKQQFQKDLKKKEDQAIKKLQEQELLKQQKKGGKDQKKVVDKKVVKKEGKDAPAVQKRKAERCDYPLHNRQYCALDGSKMYKGKSLLCVSILIE